MTAKRRPVRECPLDPVEFNLGSAWYGPPNEYSPTGWRAFHHGCGTLDALRSCDCPLCVERLTQLTTPRGGQEVPLYGARQPDHEPANTVPVAATRERVAKMLAAGMTRTQIAEAAGIDKTTVARLLRGDVARVHADTAQALLAITG